MLRFICAIINLTLAILLLFVLILDPPVFLWSNITLGVCMFFNFLAIIIELLKSEFH